MSKKNKNIVNFQIDAEELLLSYLSKNIKSNIKETKLDEFYYNDFKNEDIDKKSIQFLDPYKQRVKIWPIMIDITKGGSLPRYTKIQCWWCRNKFSGHPIGCPLKYNSKEDNRKNDHVLEYFKKNNLPLNYGTDFFETEGIFCYFTCVKSFILEELSKNKHSKYNNSLTLLTLLYFKFFGVLMNIYPSSSWKVLENQGGFMTPQQFRCLTDEYRYIETVNVKRPYMFSVSSYIEKKK